VEETIRATVRNAGGAGDAAVISAYENGVKFYGDSQFLQINEYYTFEFHWTPRAGGTTTITVSESAGASKVAAVQVGGPGVEGCPEGTYLCDATGECQPYGTPCEAETKRNWLPAAAILGAAALGGTILLRRH